MTRETKNSPSWGVVILLLILFWPVGLYLLHKKLTTDTAAILRGGKVLKVVGWVCIVLAVMYIVSGASGMETSESGEELTTVFTTFGICIGIGGAIMLVFAKRRQTKANRFKKYIAIVSNNRVRKIDTIASSIPTTYEKAYADLLEMIYKGFFEGAYIDESKREIILETTNVNDATEQQFTENQAQNDSSQLNLDALSQMVFGEQQSLQQQFEELQSSQGQYNQIHVTQTIITNQQPSSKEEKPPEKKGPRIVVCKNCGGNNKIIDGEVSECECCGSPLE
ncbi:hypothetical protein [Anaerosporobacter sp.]